MALCTNVTQKPDNPAKQVGRDMNLDEQSAVPTYAFHRNELNDWLKFAAQKSTAEMRESP